MAVMKYGTMVLLLVAFLCVGVGCGPEGPNVAPVEGVVRIDGVPTPNMVVIFNQKIIGFL